MTDVKLAQLPFLSKFTNMPTLFLGWVAFAEFEIDRHHPDRFLPFYRVGNFCPHDIAVIAVPAAVWSRFHRA